MKFSFASISLLAVLAASACVGMDMSEDELALAEHGGQLSLEWLIMDEDTLISCVDAGASEVEVAILGEMEVRLRTSCYGGFAVIDSLDSGAQLVEISLISPRGERLVITELGEIEIVAGATVPLGAVELSL